MLASLTSWFTPTSLFVIVNIMIGTIVIISRFGPQKKPDPQHQLSPHESPQLSRSSSVLDRVKSINFSLYKFHHHPQPPTEPEYENPSVVTRTPSFLERVKSINLSSLYRSESISKDDPEPEMDSTSEPKPEKNSSDHEQHGVKRSKSDSCTEAPATRMAAEKSMKKSKSEKSATETERITDEYEVVYDEEVDAKADDFINRFKQQLRLQRLDSLLRYRDMLMRK